MNVVRICAGLFASLCVPILASAQIKSGTVLPDCVHVGEVHQGAIVEASCVVFEGGTDTEIEFEVTPPKFATVLRKTKDQHNYPAGGQVRGVFALRIDTSAVGEFSGEVDVKLGNGTARIPISASVKPVKKGQPRVLIVETPFAAFTTDHADEDFKAWKNLVRDASLDVSYLDVDRGGTVLRDLELAKYDCILLADTGIVLLKPEDVKRAREFVEAGGRLVIAANAFMAGSVQKANELLEGSAIRMQNAEGRGDLNRVAFDEHDLSSLLTDAGVKSASFFRASPISVLDPRAGQVLVKAKGVGDESNGFIVVADVGQGQIIALGQSLWWSWISEKNAGETDNAGILRWLLTPVKKD